MLKILLLSGVLLGSSANAHAAGIRAGLARVDITPPIGGPTAGYASAEPTIGVHDPIDARVLVLESDSTTIALVTSDLCFFNSPWLHEQMPQIGVDQLLLMNTHTHAGPDLRDEEFPNPEAPWRTTVERRILQAIRDAQEALFPANVHAAEGGVPLGYNRLVRHGDYAITHFDNPDHIPYGPIDPTVGVIRITDERAAVRAVLVTYACHPVILGPRNRQISADYPGVMRDLVEERLGEDAICYFVQGGGGDINPLLMARGEDREGDFDVVERVGRRLAEEVLDVLERTEDEPGVSNSLSMASTRMQVKSRWDPDEELTLGVTSLLINEEIGIVTMPGEPFLAFQVSVRKMAGLSHTYLFGYCCDGPYDWPQYLPDIESAARGGYGASDTTRAEVGAGERLIHLGLRQLFKLKGRLKTQPQRHLVDEHK